MVPIEKQAEIRERWPERTIYAGSQLNLKSGLARNPRTPAYVRARAFPLGSSWPAMLMPRISMLWGNPQWQIDAVRRFQILDQLVEV